MRRLAKFLSLSAVDRRLLASAFLVVVAVRLRLALLPFRPGMESTRFREIHGTPKSSPERIAWAVDVASSRLGTVTCLARALAAHRMLARRGFPCRMCIGVVGGDRNSQGSGLIAHAWLEFGGRILVGGPDVSRYTPLFSWC